MNFPTMSNILFIFAGRAQKIKNHVFSIQVQAGFFTLRRQVEKEKLCTFSVYVDDKGICGRVAGGAPGAAADILNWYFQLTPIWGYTQWEFQDPKMEVLYHIRQYFAGIFPFIGLI